MSSSKNSPSAMKLNAWLRWASERLAAHSDTPSLDAQVLLAHVLGVKRAWTLAHPEAGLSPAQEQTFQSAVQRLQAGEALPYILGHWEFFGRDFIVTPDVLIPRPETELLVEQALAWLRAHPGARRVVEVGLGSACIAVSLAAEITALEITGVDISRPALQVARRNLIQHGVAGRVHVLQADLLSALCGPFDLLCANLPYIPSAQLQALRVARAEPALALDGGRDGLQLIRRLLADLPAKLNPGGLALLEIEASQGRAMRQLAQALLPGAQAQVLPDLAGHERLFVCQMPEGG